MRDPVPGIQEILKEFSESGKSRTFFSAIATFDNILDLTSFPTIHQTFKWCFPSLSWEHIAIPLRRMSDAKTGGNVFTDFMGMKGFQSRIQWCSILWCPRTGGNQSCLPSTIRRQRKFQ